jgi:uncharacterized protein YbjT (DUF2867 family)
MSILVVGGTGKVGSETVKRLADRGLPLRVMTRSPEKATGLPRGATAIAGDMEKPETLTEAFRGVEKLFLITPLAENETEQGLAAVAAAKKAGVKKIVYMSVFLPEDSKHIPHFKSKLPVEEAVQRSGAAWTLLRPNNFFQNDEAWHWQGITEFGIYAQPLGPTGVSRVDTRDIADGVVRALTDSGHDGQIYPINGPEALTGEGVTRLWSKHLGREIRYSGDDLDAWGKQAAQMLPAWLVHDLVIMYDYFQKQGFRGSDAELAQQRKLLGRDPRRFEDYVREVVQARKGQAAGHA